MKREKLITAPSAILIFACVALNIALSRAVLYWNLPLYLDAIGTILAAILGGYFPGAIVGLLSNGIGAIFDPTNVYYAAISVMIAMAAAKLSAHGAFRKPGGALLSVLILAVIGGGIGSVLTWLLSGLDFGAGVSAPYVLRLYQAGFPKFLAQLTADFAVDLADKLISVAAAMGLMRLIPAGWLKRLPLGKAYRTTDAASFRRAAAFGSKVRRHSISFTVTSLLLGSSVILTVVAMTIGSIVYSQTTRDRFADLGESAVNLVRQAVDGDRIADYLQYGKNADGYQSTLTDLTTIWNSIPDIKYVYVYQIREDGCHVVFDVDTPELAGDAVGTVVAFDPGFSAYIPDLLAGKEIEPIVENGQFGHLLTIYSPIYDSSGACVAYAAADISMEAVVADHYVFMTKLGSLLVCASILILAFTLPYARRRLVSPVDALSDVTGKLAYESSAERIHNIETLKGLDIKTGDEIENLYHAVTKTTEDVGDYIHQIEEDSDNLQRQAEVITKMQDNIILCFADMVENRDENTGSHIRRTADYVSAIGGRLLADGRYSDTLTPEYLEHMKKSAPLHDIGKIKVSDTILNKPGKLTPEEFAIMKTHTTAGAEILRQALSGIEDDMYLSTAIEMALCHHEWWNGAGYPAGISGEDIPLCARVMAVADVLDALLSKRSYKEPYPFDLAMDIICGESGTHFDPVCVSALLEIREDVRALSETESE